MSKLLEAEDILTEVRDFIECIGMAAAASHLAREFGAPIVAVANAASQKIDEAVALLSEYRESGSAPVPASPDAEPKSPASHPQASRAVQAAHRLSRTSAR
jgi:hypothetical protein